MEASQSGSTKRNWIIAVIATGIVVPTGWVAFSPASGPAPKKAKPMEIVSIQLPPPPPPLPPPPPRVEPPPPPEEQKMIEQAPVVEEAPPDDTPAPDEAPGEIGTGLTGDGPGGFNIGSGKGSGNGGKGGGGRRAGRFDRQTVGIQNTLLAALKRNDKTRKAVFDGGIKVWADSSGRLTRVQLEGSSGDAAADQAIREDFIGLQFPDVAGVPMPVHIRVKGRKANISP